MVPRHAEIPILGTVRADYEWYEGILHHRQGSLHQAAVEPAAPRPDDRSCSDAALPGCAVPRGELGDGRPHLEATSPLRPVDPALGLERFDPSRSRRAEAVVQKVLGRDRTDRLQKRTLPN